MDNCLYGTKGNPQIFKKKETQDEHENRNKIIMGSHAPGNSPKPILIISFKYQYQPPHKELPANFQVLLLTSFAIIPSYCPIQRIFLHLLCSIKCLFITSQKTN